MNQEIHVAYVAVGSNIEPVRNIPAALDLLSERVRVTGSSTFYRTEPISRPDQPAFLNGIWRIETDLDPRRLKFEVLRDIETRLGRVRTADKYAPRTIDLDIVLFDDLVLDQEGLTIPDPDIHTRPFIAVPLHELAPGLELPDSGQSLASLVDQISAGRMPADTELTHQLRTLLRHC